MAFRRFHGLHWLPVAAALAGILSGCSLGRSGAPAHEFQSADSSKTQSLQEAAVGLTDDGQAAPPTSPSTNPPAMLPPPPSPLTLAMAQAGSHYEQGIQALRSGNTANRSRNTPKRCSGHGAGKASAA